MHGHYVYASTFAPKVIKKMNILLNVYNKRYLFMNLSTLYPQETRELNVNINPDKGLYDVMKILSKSYANVLQMKM